MHIRDGMDNIKITLETLYDILRNEKKREDLQKLEITFFLDVTEYIKEKNTFLEQRRNDKDIFASGERDKLEYELRSIRRILKEIYEKREKKIIDIALNRSRTGSDIIDTSSMLPEEKEFYRQILQSLEDFRKGILLNMFKGEMPTVVTAPSILPMFSELSHKFKEAISEDKEIKEIKEIKEKYSQKELESPENNEMPPQKPPQTVGDIKPEIKKTKIRFIHPVPSFVWKDMKVYGPFDTGEETEIFPEVADLLVRKGRAEKVVTNL